MNSAQVALSDYLIKTISHNRRKSNVFGNARFDFAQIQIKFVQFLITFA